MERLTFEKQDIFARLQFYSSNNYLEYLVPMEQDPTAVALYSESPPNFNEFLFFDLDRELQNFKSDRTIFGSQRTKKQIHQNVVFDPLIPNVRTNGFEFKREAVVTPKPVTKSEVSRLIELHGREDPIGRKMDRVVKVPVFLPNKKKLVVHCPSDTLIDEVIGTILREYQAECEMQKQEMDLGRNPKAYLFFLAEDDGRLDEDSPVLNKTKEIGNFAKMDQSFALVYDLTFTALEEAPKKKPSKKAIRVTMPDGGSTSIAFTDTTTVREALLTVCEKRYLVPTQYILDWDVDHPKKSDPIEPEMTIASLNVDGLTLIEKKNMRRSTSINPKRATTDLSGHRDTLTDSGGLFSKIGSILSRVRTSSTTPKGEHKKGLSKDVDRDRRSSISPIPTLKDSTGNAEPEKVSGVSSSSSNSNTTEK